MIPRVLAAGMLLMAWATPSLAQSSSIRVALTFTDSAGTVRSAFASALRSLSDVEVVNSSEDYDIHFRGVVICANPCVSYAIALHLSEPPPDWFLEDQSDRSRIYAALLDFNITMYVLTWGRSRYEQAARDLVRQIDTACFERLRIQDRARRLLTSGDTAAWMRALSPLSEAPYQQLQCG